MSFTTATVNTWFQTIDGLPPTTASIPSSLATTYVGELNATPPTATPGEIQTILENGPFPPPSTNVPTDLFFRTSVAQFVLREFQGAWGQVPSNSSLTSQFDSWVARIIANPSLENGGGMSQALAGTPQFMSLYGTTSATEPATLAFVTALAANLHVAVGPGALANVNLPVWQVLQNFVESPTVIASLEGPIANFQNLLLAGQVPGGSIFNLPLPTGSLTLTTGVDTPSTGFTSGHGATATAAGSVFNALPVAGILGLNNTLNTGDNLLATDAAAGATTLNLTETFATAGILANPPFAFGVTTNGVSTLNVTNEANLLGLAINGGFQGSVTGLTTVNNNNSISTVQLGGTGQGLNTLLTNYNINDYAGPAAGAFLNVIAASAADLTKTIDIGITGHLGGTAFVGDASQIIFSNDSGTPGTFASPNNTYGTWAITFNSNTFAELDQGAVGVATASLDVGGATALTLTGANAASTFAPGTDNAGNWQLLQSIDETATTGRVIITGATAGNGTNFFASATDPLWLFGSNAGLLDDSGTGGVFDLTSVKLGSGLDVLDISSATAAQVAALTTGPGTGVTVNPGDVIIVQDSVATTGSATTFAHIAGFSVLGIGGPGVAQGAAGTINMANVNVTAAFNEILYVTQAAGSVTVNNGPSTLTVNVNHNTEAGTITTLGVNDASTTSTTDTVTLILGDTVGTVGGIAGGFIDFGGVAPDFGGAINGLATTGYANVDIQSNGPGGGAGVSANILSGDSEANVFTANPGALETLTISGSTELINNAIFVDGIGGTGVITDNDTSVTQIFGFGDNAAFSPSGPNFIATNAEVINAGGSGGLWMGASDLFFSSNGAGDFITGSATASNVLAGSVGNDTFTGGSATDLIITDNGGDIVNLAASHTAATIDLFFGDFPATGSGFDFGLTAAGTFTEVTGLADSITSGADLPAAGTWGVAPAVTAAGTPTASPSSVFTLFPGTTAINNGTSADMTTVSNFHTGSDAVQFSVGAWENTLRSGDTFGAIAAGTAADINTVSAGSIVPLGTNVIELNQVFANANAVALALGDNVAGGGSNYDVIFRAAPGATPVHFLVAYQTPGGATDIADVDIHGGSIFSILDHVAASDMVQLTGVPVTSLANANVHFVA